MEDTAPALPSPPIKPARVAFVALWIAVQATLVVSADARPDGAFGFRMFSESSTIELSLNREIVGEGEGYAIVHADNGKWVAKDEGSIPRRFAWSDRVKRPELAIFDATFSASYGVRAQVSRAEAALNDVAAHIENDTETRRLLLDVTIRKNGRDPETFHFSTKPRF